MAESIDTEAIEPGQGFSVDYFRPEDAPGVAALYKAVYGDGYPVKTYYHPKKLIEAAQKGEIAPCVARTAKGEVVGAVALYRTAPCPRVYEGGGSVVLPSFRRRGMNTQLNLFVLKKVVRQIGAVLIFGEAVCNHIYQQKSQAAAGLITAALELDLMPAAAYSQENSAVGRVACLIDFLEYEPRPHRVHIPGRYREQLRKIYEWSGLNREQVVVSAQATADGATDHKVQTYDFAKVARLTIERVGGDFEDQLGREVEGLVSGGLELVQAWLPLSDPAVGLAAEALHSMGFVFGGLLPRWFDHDGMLMQRPANEPNWDDIHLYSARAKNIMQMVRSEWLEL